eukprot:scaffold2639_cov361-Pavlova_lutheri.AAC.68
MQTFLPGQCDRPLAPLPSELVAPPKTLGARFEQGERSAELSLIRNRTLLRAPCVRPSSTFESRRPGMNGYEP